MAVGYLLLEWVQYLDFHLKSLLKLKEYITIFLFLASLLVEKDSENIIY